MSSVEWVTDFIVSMIHAVVVPSMVIGHIIWLIMIYSKLE